MFSVLVIDNDKAMYQFLKLALVQNQIDSPLFYFAKDFYEAGLICSTERIDMALVDIHLKEVSGAAVIDATKALIGNKPVVIFTDYNDEETALECIKNGAQDYILKRSVNIKQLVKSLKYTLTRYQVMTQLKQADLVV